MTRGVTQYVVLGAGLDTFAYRNTNAALRVFEVDAPSTQAWKRQLLRDEHIAAPPNLTFVPVDFEKQSLAEELARAGFDVHAKTVFAWLGVSMYLTLDAVMSTLRYIAAATPTAAAWCSTMQAIPGDCRGCSVSARACCVRGWPRLASPFRTFFEPGDLVARLRELGFDEVQNLDGNALNRGYFSQRSDGLRVGTLGQIMTAFRWVRIGAK